MRLHPRRLALFLLPLVLALFGPGAARAQTFALQYSFPASVNDASISLGDYDGDGDLDIARTGVQSGGAATTKIFRNDGGGVWTDIGAPLVNLGSNACIRWGDYDGDGDLDLVEIGVDATSTARGLLYRNDGGGVFTLVSGAGIPARTNATVVWGDFDNDGHLDLAVSGRSGPVTSVFEIWRQDAGQFTLMTGAGLPALSGGGLDAADMDGDGDLDLLATGMVSSSQVAVVLRNDGDHWTDVGAPLLGLDLGRAVWGDYDADGLPDIAINGRTAGSSYASRIYHNTGGGIFVDAGVVLAVGYGTVSWSDFDGDGDLDLLATGFSGATLAAGIAVNSGGTFAYAAHGLIGNAYGEGVFGDLTGDGVPDVALTGSSAPSFAIDNRTYTNSGGPANAAPGAPTGLTSSVALVNGSPRVTFRWTRPTDDHTPRTGLTFELRVGTTAGGAQVTGAFADPATGTRRLARFGSQGSDSTWTLTLPPGTYYWSVQAVDGAQRGGAFAAEQSATVQPLLDAGFSMLASRGGTAHTGIAWADDDGDGDLDLLVSGSTDGLPPNSRTRLYRNTGGTLTTLPVALPNLVNSALAWGDFDRDGDLDLALTGVDSTNTRITRIYRNDGAGTFTNLGAPLTVTAGGGLAWADVDGDGDLDLAIAGSATGGPSGATARLYRNDGGTFVDAAAGLKGITQGAPVWGDVDGDGDPDLLVVGLDSLSAPSTTLYLSTAGSLTATTSGLPGLANSAAAFGDFDGDGDLDLAIAGTTTINSSTFATTRIYSNDGAGHFTRVTASLSGVWYASLAWGDVDGDGDLDLAYMGQNTVGVPLTRVARNNGDGTFTEVDLGLPNVEYGGLAWGDVNGDGKLDLAIAGYTGLGALTRVYINVVATANTAPTAPGGLTASTSGVTTTFAWTKATDGQTAQNGLSYELRVGLTPNGGQIVSLPADSVTGWRQVASIGSLQGTSTSLSNLPDGDYTWAVQAVDASLAGGPFATGSFVLSRMQDSGIALTGVTSNSNLYHTALAWGDVDGDGQLDLLLAGQTNFTNSSTAKTRLYRNVSGSLTVLPTTLPNVTNGRAAWGDFDRDGDLDLAMGGLDSTATRILRIYRNDGAGNFTDIGAGLPGLGTASPAWVDFDGDGDLDLYVSGTPTGSSVDAIARIYRNDGGTFTDANAGLVGLFDGSAAWGDLDGDGDPDLVACGLTQAGLSRTVIARNAGGAFTLDTTSVAGVNAGSVTLGDVDGDGDLDLVITGTTTGSASGAVTQLYDNDGTGHFTLHPTSLPGVVLGDAKFGDYDGDGDLDLALTGQSTSPTRIARIARNEGGGTFKVLDVGLPGLTGGGLAWGDVDGDGRLDLAMSGYNGTIPVAKVFTRVASLVNTVPTAPTNLAATGSLGHVVLRWSSASDSRTPAAALSYDVRVGLSNAGGQIVSLPADSTSGLRRLPQRGACEADSCVLSGLVPGVRYYWSVQSVDASFAGSAPAAWQSFVWDPTLGVNDTPEAAPRALALRAVAPNPVVGAARIAFDLPRTGEVNLAVFDASGRLVRTLASGPWAAGERSVTWDGRSESGQYAAAGVYFVRLSAAGRSVSTRLVRVR